jgi:hypothetical protein
MPPRSESTCALAALREAPLSVDEVLDAVRDPASGAVVVFIGVVRDHDHGVGVDALDYSAHPSALDRLQEVCASVGARTPGVRLAAVHRIGALTVGTTPTVRFSMSEAPAGAAALLMLGSSNAAVGGIALPFGLDAYGFPGITLWTSADVTLLAYAGASGMGSGYAAFDIPLPTGHSISTTGTPFFAQWLWLDLNNLANHGSTAGQRFKLQ